MHQHIASSRPLRRLLVASVLGLALVSLVGLGVGFSVKAQQPDEVDITGIEGQAVSSTAARYSTHPVSSYATISETGWVSGTGTLVFTATVPLSPTVTVCGSGKVTVTVRYTPSGSISVSIEGATPSPTSVELPVTAGYRVYTINGWETIVYATNRKIKSSILVTGTGPVTITGSGPVGGETGVLVEGPVKHCLGLPMMIRSRSNVVFFDNFSNPESGWPSATHDVCSYGYKDGRFEVKVYEHNERCLVPAFPVPPVSTGTYSLTVRRTTSADREVMYGFFFRAGPNALKNHWALEVFPNPTWDDEPFFWLVAIVDGDREMFKEVKTDKIHTGKDDWNNLMVTQDGNEVKVYINGSLKKSENDDYLKDDPDYRYFDLEVTSLDPDTSTDNPIIVQFDDFTVLSDIVGGE